MTEAQSENVGNWVDIPIPLPEPGTTAPFIAGGRELLLCNADGTPYVVRDQCPHAGAQMQGGALRGTVLECPMHGGSFDVRDGSPVARPIRRAGWCHPVRAHGDGWQVDLG